MCNNTKYRLPIFIVKKTYEMLLVEMCGYENISMPDISNYEVEASEHFNSVHIEGGGPVDEYNHYDQQPEEPVVEYEYVKAAPEEEFLSASQYVVNQQQESSPVVAEEPIVEPRKFTYASIVCISTFCSTFLPVVFIVPLCLDYIS